MIERFAGFPEALARQARTLRLGSEAIPALLVHPDWTTPAPTVLWLHGRTASKETDPGRYLRWMRAGLAVCAPDLPGHGERPGAHFQQPQHTIDLLARTIPEIDQMLEALADPALGSAVGVPTPTPEGLFDLDQLAVGGMSAGGVAVLRRLCDEHPFVCAIVEGTTGCLEALLSAAGLSPQTPPGHARLVDLDPVEHLGTWRPIPLLALHSEADRVVPVASMRRFIERLQRHYADLGADPAMVQFITWPRTGAPEEHVGFGARSNEAKNIQTAFLRRHLRATAT